MCSLTRIERRIRFKDNPVHLSFRNPKNVYFIIAMLSYVEGYMSTIEITLVSHHDTNVSKALFPYCTPTHGNCVCIDVFQIASLPEDSCRIAY